MMSSAGLGGLAPRTVAIPLGAWNTALDATTSAKLGTSPVSHLNCVFFLQ